MSGKLRLIAHTCACGAQYTMAEWLRLTFKGVQKFERDAEEEAAGLEPLLDLELRNCVRCGSTRAMEIIHGAHLLPKTGE